jgi:hypothetical protein
MDDRNVREQQQEAREVGKRQESHSSASQREGGSRFSRQNRHRVPQEWWPPLLAANEVATAMRMSRKAVYAMAESAQPMPHVTRGGRRLVVRRDDLLLWRDERRAASPGGEIKLSLGDERAAFAAAPINRFRWSPPTSTRS